MHKKSTSLLLAAMLITLCLTSCGRNDSENTSSEPQITSEASGVLETISYVSIGDVTFDVDSVNSDNGIVRIYNRDYKTDRFNLSIVIPADYACATFKTYSDYTYSLEGIDKKSGGSVDIPVNGFLLLIPISMAENVSFENGTTAVLTEYTSPEYENLAICSVIPSKRAHARRINMLYPESGEPLEGKIYFCSEDTDFTVPDNSVALLLKGGIAGNYTVTGHASAGTPINGTPALLFCGEYNAVYAVAYYPVDEKISIARSNYLNAVTDLPFVTINGTLYPLELSHLNSEAPENGINIFNNNYSRLVTPEFDDECVSAVITEGKVVYISSVDERLVIPTDNSFVITFSGDAADIAKALRSGMTVEHQLVTPSKKPERYILAADRTFKYDATDVELNGYGTVLYTSANHSETTNTPNGTFEITFIDGLITAITTTGNSKIPLGGYVMSIAKNSSAYKMASALTVGNEVHIASGGFGYSTTVLYYTRVNDARLTDDLVIYDRTFGNYTKTNVYGYEIVVDENGIVIGGSTAGNSEIPDGGFVVSGHGKNDSALQKIFALGSRVTWDRKTKSVTFTSSPALKVVSAASQLDEIKSRLEDAKSNLYAIDYKTIDSKLDAADGVFSKANDEFEKGNLDNAISLSSVTSDMLSQIEYSLYESSSVDNRSTWYRANEKNDSEVRTTVEKMAALGINAVYIETWYNGQTIGYSSDPRIKHNSNAHGDYDVLEGFCRIAHEYGIEVHAWCENFFIGTPGGYLVELMKDKRCVDRNGKDNYPCGYGNFVFLNPNDRECRDLVLGVYKELVTKYDLDGLHLDYIRFSEPNPDNGDFGYNQDIIEGFQKAHNTTVDPHDIKSNHPLWSSWCKYREEIINSFVSEVFTALKAIDSDLYISAACYPDFPNMPTWNFQNFRDWVSKGYMDEIFSMSYGADLSYPVNNAKAFIKAIDGKCFYSIGVCAFDNTAAKILVEQIYYAKLAGASGSNPFSWGSLVAHKENYYDALKAGVYSRIPVKQSKGSKTVAAGLGDLIYNIDNVYSYLKPEYTDYYAKLKSEAHIIIDAADAFDYESANDADKLAYCNSAIKEIESLYEIAKTVDEPALKTAAIRTIDTVNKALDITVLRLTAALDR